MTMNSGAIVIAPRGPMLTSRIVSGEFAAHRTSTFTSASPNWPDSPCAKVWSRDLDSAVICVAATPNASFVAAACMDRSVSLFSGEGELCWRRTVNSEAWAVALSADGATIAVGTAAKHPAAGTVFVFDRTGEERWRMAFDAPVWSVALSDDGERLVVGCWNNFVYLFDAAHGPSF